MAFDRFEFDRVLSAISTTAPAARTVRISWRKG